MFDRTVSFFRHLIGRQTSTGPTATLDEPDRRNHMRYPADLETRCKPAGAGPDGPGGAVFPGGFPGSATGP